MSSREAASEINISGLRPIDIVTLGYISFELVMVLLFMTGYQGWYFFIVFYLAIAGFAAIISNSATGSFWKPIRLSYPILIMILFFRALRRQIFMVHGLSFDSSVHSLEKSIFGSDIAFLLQPYMQIWLNELMSFFYLSYYALLTLALMLLAGRGLWRSMEKMVLAAVCTFFISYAIFILFPVLGPRLYLDNIYYLPMIGPLFSPLAEKIISEYGLLGGAMPSTHCAIALVITWFLTKEFKWLRIPLLIEFVMLCLATVYGRYHYVSDVILGIVLASVAIIVTSRWQDRFDRRCLALLQANGAMAADKVEISV